MEEVDRVVVRVSLATGAGLVSGSLFAIYRGIALFPTAIRVAGSFALASTACFGSERIANVCIRQVADMPRSKLMYASHGVGGAFGGAVAGGLYQGRIIPGMLLFTPIMLAVSVAELKFEQVRAEKFSERMNAIRGAAAASDVTTETRTTDSQPPIGKAS